MPEVRLWSWETSSLELRQGFLDLNFHSISSRHLLRLRALGWYLKRIEAIGQPGYGNVGFYRTMFPTILVSHRLPLGKCFFIAGTRLISQL